MKNPVHSLIVHWHRAWATCGTVKYRLLQILEILFIFWLIFYKAIGIDYVYLRLSAAESFRTILWWAAIKGQSKLHSVLRLLDLLKSLSLFTLERWRNSRTTVIPKSYWSRETARETCTTLHLININKLRRTRSGQLTSYYILFLWRWILIRWRVIQVPLAVSPSASATLRNNGRSGISSTVESKKRERLGASLQIIDNKILSNSLIIHEENTIENHNHDGDSSWFAYKFDFDFLNKKCFYLETFCKILYPRNLISEIKYERENLMGFKVPSRLVRRLRSISGEF